jgi:SAM-dependent methyltransferase
MQPAPRPDAEALFATPRRIESLDDCDFYHTMELPGWGLVSGPWDLRGMVDRYLGGVAFGGKRVLEIGPASGFLTVEMERRGAQIVALEVPDEPGWDFVPYPEERLAAVREDTRCHMNRIKNSFWLTHAAYRSNAKLVYADVYRIPEALGAFDVAVMAAVLLHCRNPLAVIEQCARRANVLIIAERFFPDLEGSPLCRLAPGPENFAWDTWWEFSTEVFRRFLGTMGFSCRTTTYRHRTYGRLFTITAARAENGTSATAGFWPRGRAGRLRRGWRKLFALRRHFGTRRPGSPAE